MAPEGGLSSERMHERKGRIKRLLGWLTADRRVEAEGLAEERSAGHPSDRQVERTEHEIKQHEYKETLDAPETGDPDAGVPDPQHRA